MKKENVIRGDATREESDRTSNEPLWTEAEVYTAITELAPLLPTLDRIIKDLEYFIEKEEIRADTLKTQLKMYEKEKEIVSKDYSEYLENPVNAYILIKRLTFDLDYLIQNVQNITKQNGTINLRHEDLKYPTLEDLVGSALALSRLQNTYELNVTKLAEERLTNASIGQLNMYKKEKEIVSKDYSEYLENPVNAYVLIKRLTFDLDYLIQNITKQDGTIKLRHENLKYPTLEDLVGSALALSRLQNTYELNVTKLAEERLTNASIGNSMTVNDCFKLGQILYQHKKFKHSLEWLIEALRKYKKENVTYGVSEILILNYISYALYYTDDAKTVFKSTKQTLDIDKEYAIKIEDSISALQNIEMLEELPSMEDTSAENEESSEEYQRYFRKEQFVYEALCRGEIDLPTETCNFKKMYDIEIISIPRLKCSYLTDTHPFLKLAPIKTEQLYIEPDVFVFYNVISDEEIEHLKILSKQRLKRSEVAGYSDFTNETIAKYRSSKTAWLYDYDSSVAARVSRRAADFTGFSTATAEPLQIVNYGLGGHFSPHFDFFLKDSEPELPKMKKYGNRIATTIFYMSDVTQGGATVFTELGLTVFPVKNAALYWLNLHPSGEGDITTRHAACPVLRGSKWISNKWFHLVGQETIRPCNLEYQIENVKRKTFMPRPKTSNEYHRQLIFDWFTNNGLEKCMYE
ncbi:Prolyl 4-hydroxylase subunit alpha-2 [Papilio machaon]|uniref:procollagen-proline 4-dioxygenase n=1 Tax=Papilio machaon TaxID=76193 RepID=A0A194R5Q5_PAPMA|nr:Prolyl 4-hydroxylase subunit alpha-2 [Papilio machaon]